MANTTHPKRPTKETHRSSRKSNQAQNKNKEKQPQPPPPPPPTPPQPPQQLPSWAVMKSILTCKHLDAAIQEESRKKSKKMRCSGSLCNNTKVMQRPDPPSPAISSSRDSSSSRSMISSVTTTTTTTSSSSSSSSSGGVLIKGMPFRRLSGCYECRMVVDPSLRATICTCPHCGEIFMSPDNLDHHQAVRHAVSEVGPEDTTKNIVEIIFQSSWLVRNQLQTPLCHIDRILKVNNTQKTINKFEEYRDSIKSKASNKHPRCIADGNELLRFHSTTFKCSLGLNGSSNLCNSIPRCNVCAIIKNGFKLPAGILTTATSGRAHDLAELVLAPGGDHHNKRAMLVCRVIAGRVKKTPEGGTTGGGSPEEYDSVAGAAAGVYSDLDELCVFNPKAILPCFVVIYRGF